MCKKLGSFSASSDSMYVLQHLHKDSAQKFDPTCFFFTALLYGISAAKSHSSSFMYWPISLTLCKHGRLCFYPHFQM